MKRLHFRSLGKMDMFTLLNCQFHSRNILKSDFLSDFQTLCVWSLLQSAQTPKSCCAPPLAVFREKKCQKYCNILIEDTVLLHCTKIFFSLRRAAYTAVVSYYIVEYYNCTTFLCCIDKCKRESWRQSRRTKMRSRSLSFRRRFIIHLAAELH